MTRRQQILTIAIVVGGAIPLIGIIVMERVSAHRSPADLELADRCVDWAHKPRDARVQDGPEVAASCERYFRVRSDENADEDDRRWQARATQHAALPASQLSGEH